MRSKLLKRLRLFLVLSLLLFFGGTATATTLYFGGFGRVLPPTVLLGHTCVTTDDYYGTPGNQGMAWYINSTQTATLTVYRVDAGGATRAQSSSSQTVTANLENVQLVLYPINRTRLTICNTTGSSATVNADANELGGRIR